MTESLVVRSTRFERLRGKRRAVGVRKGHGTELLFRYRHSQRTRNNCWLLLLQLLLQVVVKVTIPRSSIGAFPDNDGPSLIEDFSYRPRCVETKTECAVAVVALLFRGTTFRRLKHGDVVAIARPTCWFAFFFLLAIVFIFLGISFSKNNKIWCFCRY